MSNHKEHTLAPSVLYVEKWEFNPPLILGEERRKRPIEIEMPIIEFERMIAEYQKKKKETIHVGAVRVRFYGRLVTS